RADIFTSNEILPQNKPYTIELNYVVPRQYTDSNRKPTNTRIETPLFLALLHELVHARRFQLGINAEFDEINTASPGPNDANPKALMALIANQADDVKKSIASRYKGWNREELDTIEGWGAPVAAPATSAAYKAALAAFGGDANKVPVTSDGELRVTENLLRKELGIHLRYRYVSGVNDDITAAAADKTTHSLPGPTPIPRKYFRAPPIDKPKFVEPKEPTLGDIADEVQNLFSAAGVGPKALKMGPDGTCFVL